MTGPRSRPVSAPRGGVPPGSPPDSLLSQSSDPSGIQSSHSQRTRESLDANGEGVQHLAFQIADLDKTVKRFESLGMPVIHQGRFDGNNGSYSYLDSKRALGVTVELLHSDPKKQ